MEEEVCVRLSVLGYGKKEEMLSSLSGELKRVKSRLCSGESENREEEKEEKVDKRSMLVLPWCGKVDESVCLN